MTILIKSLSPKINKRILLY